LSKRNNNIEEEMKDVKFRNRVVKAGDKQSNGGYILKKKRNKIYSNPNEI